MKTKAMLVVMILSLGVVVLLAAQATTSKQSGQAQASASSQDKPAKTWHLPKGWSPDQAYKSNCTRCHAEVPKLDPQRTKTVVRHMRVRANMTKDEAEAILEYLNK